MNTIEVTSQAEFNAEWNAHKNDPGVTILIDAPSSEHITVRDSGAAKVEAQGHVTISAFGHATVKAHGYTTVWAYGDATVEAYGFAAVRLFGYAKVWAFDDARVQAYDSATVKAYDSATVRAHDDVTVDAYGSVTVWAYDSATVRASAFVVVHLRSRQVTLTGGVVIDASQLDLSDVDTWVAYTGAEVRDGHVVLYKAVDADLYAGHLYRPTAYPIGADVTAPDWRDDNECGGGLHASPHPHQALSYYPDAARMLEVTVPLADLRPIPGDTPKAKARTVTVVREVALNGEVAR